MPNETDDVVCNHDYLKICKTFRINIIIGLLILILVGVAITVAVVLSTASTNEQGKNLDM